MNEASNPTYMTPGPGDGEKPLITKDEAYSICNFIDMNLIDGIRNDPDCDSLQWLRNIVHGYEKLCAYCVYVGLTEDTPKKEEERT